MRVCPLPLGGAVAQRLRGFKSAEPEKTVKRSSRRTGVNLQFFPVGAHFFRIVKGEQPLVTGCGSQHPLRALGGTRVLLAAAPTTPPCFRRWRLSSSLHFAHHQRNNYLKFRNSGKSADFPELPFHGRGRNGQRHLQRRLLCKRGAAGEGFCRISAD